MRKETIHHKFCSIDTLSQRGRNFVCVNEKVFTRHPSSKIVAPRVSYRLSQPRLALGTLYTRVGAYLLTQTTLASRVDGDAQMVVRSNPGDRSRVTDYGYDRFQGNFLHTLSIQP